MVIYGAEGRAEDLLQRGGGRRLTKGKSGELRVCSGGRWLSRRRWGNVMVGIRDEGQVLFRGW